MEAAAANTMIREAGGLAFLAHPAANDRQMKETPQILIDLKQMGLAGLELQYPTHTPKISKTLRHLGEELGLLVSGGSDFHGDGKPHIKLGRWPKGQPIPYELLTAIKQQS